VSLSGPREAAKRNYQVFLALTLMTSVEDPPQILSRLGSRIVNRDNSVDQGAVSPNLIRCDSAR